MSLMFIEKKMKIFKVIDEKLKKKNCFRSKDVWINCREKMKKMVVQKKWEKKKNLWYE